jgi:hypothetical protein
VGNWLSLFAWGWRIDILEIKIRKSPGRGMVTGRIEPCITQQKGGISREISKFHEKKFKIRLQQSFQVTPYHAICTFTNFL